MASAFDFEEYYTENTAKTEVAIDRSGVEVENPSEANEAVTNNVMYYINEIYYGDKGNPGSTHLLQDNCRVIVGLPSGRFTYLARWHSISNAIDNNLSGTWEPGYERLSVLTLDAPTADNGFTYWIIDDVTGALTEVGAVSMFVFPRYEAESGRGESIAERMVGGTERSYDIDQNPVGSNPSPSNIPCIMRMLYAALGFYGGKGKSYTWLTNRKGPVRTDYSAVIQYDTFRKRLKALSEACTEANIGMSVTYYDNSYAIQAPNPDDPDIDITATSLGARSTFDEVYGDGQALDMFLTNAYTAPLVDRVDSEHGNPTALIPPLKDVIKAFYYPATELEEEFSELFKNVFDELYKVPAVWGYVKSSDKANLETIGARYINRPSGDGKLAFDLESMVDRLYDIPNINVINSMFTMTYPRMVQANSALRDGVWSTPVLSINVSGCFVGGWEAFGGDTGTNKRVTDMSAKEIVEWVTNVYNQFVRVKKPPLMPEADPANYEGLYNMWVENNGVLPGAYSVFNNYITYMLWVAALMNQVRACDYDWGTLQHEWFDAGKPFDMTVAPTKYFMRNVSGIFRDATPEWNKFTGSYRVIDWAYATPANAYADGEQRVIPGAYRPNMAVEWLDISELPLVSAGNAVQAIWVMKKIYRQMKSALISHIVAIGPVKAYRANEALEDIAEDIARLFELADHMMWYQRLVKESPFTNLSMIPDEQNYPDFPTWTLPGRLMFPVLMYRRVKKKYKRWGRTRHRWVKRSIGVRWVEVSFIDTNVYAEYPQVTDAPGETVQINETVRISAGAITFENPLPENVLEAAGGKLELGNGVRLDVTVVDDYHMATTDSIRAGQYHVVSIKIPLAKSQKDGTRDNVTISYRMPGLPYDSEIRKKAFMDYGSLSQRPGFEVYRNSGTDENMTPGWIVFHPSSNDIADMRDGIGIRDKVAMLITILKHEFGDKRVELVETYRSAEDQASRCSGAGESAFLSWHNYGLAAKILIYRNDGMTPLDKDEDAEDLKKLTEIARAFTDCCLEGRIGVPCNVVWCARLVIGSSIFDWEFLPIGTGHKDAPLYREKILAQSDPIHELAYVDVDAAGYVRTKRVDGQPWVNPKSDIYLKSPVYGGHHFMSPDDIIGYEHVSDIVLYDVKEYVDLINLKMQANGTGMPPSGNIYDWKSMNGPSCQQLIRYFGLTGNISAAKSIIAGDFVERYLPIEEMYFNTDPVEYVKQMLGRHYYDVRITVDKDGDASYITLNDGILHVKSLASYPDNLPTRLDMHKQQQIDQTHVIWGSWHNGIFYSEAERPVDVIDSDGPVIDGYKDGVAEGGEAMLLHSIIAQQVHAKFVEIRDMFEKYSGILLYDRVEDGPNAELADMLENEFGLIKAQDLIDFDDLEQLFKVQDVNADSGYTAFDDTDGSIYEKVVNNAQVNGIKLKSLSKEHIHIRDGVRRDQAQRIYDTVIKGKGYMANDLL